MQKVSLETITTSPHSLENIVSTCRFFALYVGFTKDLHRPISQ